MSLLFCANLDLLSYFVFVSSEGSGENAKICMIIGAFTGCQHNKLLEMMFMKHCAPNHMLVHKDGTLS